jgi:subtilisin family serine protease
MDCTSNDVCQAINDTATTDTDGDGHGTHCAGTVAGVNVGASPCASIKSVKVLGDDGSGSYAGILAGYNAVLDFALSNPTIPVVSSASIGGPTDNWWNQQFDTVLKSLMDVGVVNVVAAGNENSDSCNSLPARSSFAVTVAAYTSSGSRSSFSNKGRDCTDMR